MFTAGLPPEPLYRRGLLPNQTWSMPESILRMPSPQPAILSRTGYTASSPLELDDPTSPAADEPTTTSQRALFDVPARHLHIPQLSRYPRRVQAPTLAHHGIPRSLVPKPLDPALRSGMGLPVPVSPVLHDPSWPGREPFRARRGQAADTGVNATRNTAHIHPARARRISGTARSIPRGTKSTHDLKYTTPMRGPW